MSLTPEIDRDTDALAAMLSDPEIRQSLAVIVANAPTLAALAAMSTAWLQRGPEISDNINGLVRQLRSEGAGDERGIGSALSLLKDLGARTDQISALLDSAVLSPTTVQVIGNLGAAAAEADAKTHGRQNQVGGLFAILGQLKDPDVQNTLAFLFEFARTFGKMQRGQ